MSEEDIIIPEHRKNKNDKRAKRRYNKYKKGGHSRLKDNSNISK